MKMHRTKTIEATIRGRKVNVTIPDEERGKAPMTHEEMRAFVAEAIEAYCEASHVSLDNVSVDGLRSRFTINGLPWVVVIVRR